MNRKTPYIVALFCLFTAYCKTPMPVTFHPDNFTNANGTAGSANMTNELPPKNNTVRIKHDTLKLPNDTVIVKPRSY
jgi:hypothetical protein